MRAEADFAASFARVIVEWGVGAEGDGDGPCARGAWSGSSSPSAGGTGGGRGVRTRP